VKARRLIATSRLVWGALLFLIFRWPNFVNAPFHALICILLGVRNYLLIYSLYMAYFIFYMTAVCLPSLAGTFTSALISYGKLIEEPLPVSQEEAYTAFIQLGLASITLNLLAPLPLIMASTLLLRKALRRVWWYHIYFEN